MTERTPVLIVGAGPVGLALAGDLGWRGVPCTLIEKTDGAHRASEDGPRRRAHHGVLPALGHRRLGARRALSGRLSAGLRLRHRPQRLRARPRAVSRPRRTSRCPPQSPQKRERVPQDMFDPILQALRATVPARDAALPHRADRLRGARQRRSSPPCATRRPARHARSRPTIWSAPTAARASCASTLGITMSGNPALTYTTNVIFRCPDFAVAARQGQGLPLHLHRAGRHLADHRGDQRRRPLPHVDRRLGREGDPHRGRHPRRAAARDGQARLRLRDPVGAALGAARAGRRPLRHATASSSPATPPI